MYKNDYVEIINKLNAEKEGKRGQQNSFSLMNIFLMQETTKEQFKQNFDWN